MAKAPIPGFAKTRLCPPATPEQAAQLAAASLLDTLDAALGTGAPVVVALTGDVAHGVMASEVQHALRRVDVIPQRGDGLGERLAHAHADAAVLQPGAPVLQIGMDTPQVTARVLAAAMAPVAAVSPAPNAVSPIPDAVSPAPDVDAVLGAATDGGWWALGLRDPAHASVLTDVPMSTSETGDRTRHALRARGLRVADLPVLSDVDTMADARRIAPEVPDSRFARTLTKVLAAPTPHARTPLGAHTSRS
ncbi:TIGR04282 family arsenosugar biosynthesis glycosyltransferase [Haloechinothrix salitolerans]|uniref:DUF2064 domain-containing protein n=1 Tax=Haloechinothrix salitolerans TaxID=926830 RepID=A0ABW2BXK0_9PSEU